MSFIVLEPVAPIAENMIHNSRKLPQKALTYPRRRKVSDPAIINGTTAAAQNCISYAGMLVVIFDLPINVLFGLRATATFTQRLQVKFCETIRFKFQTRSLCDKVASSVFISKLFKYLCLKSSGLTLIKPTGNSLNSKLAPLN